MEISGKTPNRPKRRNGPGLLALAPLTLLLSTRAIAGITAAQELPATLQELFLEGVQAEKAGNLDLAEKDFLQVLRRGGEAAFVYNNLGIVYQLRGDHHRALVQFREAIRLKPDYAAPRVLMGASLRALGDVAGAVRELETAVKLQPQEPLARQELARAYERAGNLPGVVEQYHVLRELVPLEPEYAYQLGRTYLKLAGWCFQEIVRTDPTSARAYQALAENYQATGRTLMAVRAFQRALQADPGLPGIHLTLAQHYNEQGDIESARREVDEELRIVPESLTALALKHKLNPNER